MVAQNLNPILQEEHHRTIVVFTAALWAAVKKVPDRVDADDVGRRIVESAADASGHQLHALFIQQQPELWRDHQRITRLGQDRLIQPQLLQAFA